MFLFEDVAVEDGKTMQGYDAIVVEQWTVLKVRVQFFFDLLFFFFVNQIAGWRQTCIFTCPSAVAYR